MTLLQLRNEDARVVYLATVYHLGRPGSETDPETLQRHDLGLRSINAELREGLERAVVEIDVSPYQLRRIGEALLGLTNELKQYGIANGYSMVPGFSEALHALYPETAEDPGSAMDLVQHPVMLRNRMAQAIEDAERQLEAEQETRATERREQRGRWWQVWRRPE
jgi:hypothetical protein